MAKRSHLLLLTIAVDAMLLIGTMQAQAESQEDEPPLVVQVDAQAPGSTISDTLSPPPFSTLVPEATPPNNPDALP